MSCNMPYFKALMSAVKNTWAKPLIENKYPNITWFGYTSCDKQHPKPCIDLDEHMIYVECDDTLRGSYVKTQKAYNMIKDVVDFDFVVRTNTSVFVNIDKLLEKVSSLDDEYTVCGQFTKHGYENTSFWLIIGMFYIMSKTMFAMGMEGDEWCVKNSKGEIVDWNDDIVMSKKINDKLGDNYNGIGINYDKKLPIYKGYIEGDTFKEFLLPHNFVYPTDPNCVNDYLLTRVRSLYNGENYKDRYDKGYEIQHMYELYTALRNKR